MNKFLILGMLIFAQSAFPADWQKVPCMSADAIRYRNAHQDSALHMISLMRLPEGGLRLAIVHTKSARMEERMIPVGALAQQLANIQTLDLSIPREVMGAILQFGQSARLEPNTAE